MYIHNLCKILFKKETNPTITKTFLTVKTTNQILIRDNCVRICCANHYTKLHFIVVFVWCHINNWFSNFQKRLEDFCSLAFLLKYHFSGEPLIELGEPNPIFLTQSPTYSRSSHCQSSDFD